MANCIKCGAVIDDNGNVCPICGSSQVLEQQTVEPVTPSPQTTEPVVQTPLIDTNQQASPAILTSEPVVETPVQQTVEPPTEVPIQSSAPVQEVKNKKDKKSLIMPIIIGVLLVIIVILIILLVTKKCTVNEENKDVPVSKDVRKNMNVQLGDYSFTIPEDWNIMDNSNNLYVLFHKNNELEDITILLKVFRIDLKTVTNIKDKIQGIGYNINEEKEIKLKNIEEKCKYFSTKSASKIYDIYYVPTFADETIMINIVYQNEESKNKYSKQVNEFLDSLKYIDELKVINDFDEYQDNYLNFKSAISSN